MFHHWRLQRRCRQLAGQCRQASLRTYVEACAVMQIESLVDTPIIAVDLELTGLDARKNQIIAIGWTLVDDGRIRFGCNRHMMINAEQSVGHSAAIHELMDSDVAKGVSLETGLQKLFEAATGRVWLFHHAGLDVAFLQRACIALNGVAPPFAVMDTLHMELALRKRRDHPVKHGELQLSTLRSSYNLPRYTAHNALIDACATAELMLAIASRLDSSGSLGLQRHVKFF